MRKEFAPAVKEALHLWLDTIAAPALLEAARAQAPKDTGAFAESLEARVVGDAVHIRSDSEKPRAIWITRGTAAHIIQGSPFLAFESDGETIFARQVNHPGTKPNDFARRAAEEVMPALKKELRAMIKKALKE